jgi:hypothetical protein
MTPIQRLDYICGMPSSMNRDLLKRPVAKWWPKWTQMDANGGNNGISPNAGSWPGFQRTQSSNLAINRNSSFRLNRTMVLPIDPGEAACRFLLWR